MGIFDFIRKKQAPLTTEEQLDKMWALWAEGKLNTPCAALMTYESEVNNGGHSQYFFNVANGGNLKTEIDALLRLLPEPLRDNLSRGYLAFAAQENIADDVNDDLFDACDRVFYENEQLLIDVLKAYASGLAR